MEKKEQRCACCHEHGATPAPLSLTVRLVFSLAFIILALGALKPFLFDQVFNRGCAYFAQPLFDDAVRQYKKAIFLYRDCDEAWDWLAYSYKCKGDTGKAIDIYEEALRVNPDNRQARFSLGMIFAANRDFERAAGHFKYIAAMGKETEEEASRGLIPYHRSACDMLVTCYKKLDRADDLKDASLLRSKFYPEGKQIPSSGAAAVTPAARTQTINVVTSFYPIYIMALNVCKDIPGVTVTNLTPPMSGCLHDYSITAGDMKKVESADIFIANGAGMESFLGRISGLYPHIRIAKLADDIQLIKEAEGDNPHVWVSITGAMREVDALGSAMERFDPAHRELYMKNTGRYIAKLSALRDRMNNGLSAFKGRKIVTFHEAFPYFAREFGLEIAAVVQREPGSEPSAKELAETVDLIRRRGIKVLFAEPQYPASAAKVIAKETGAGVYVLDPAVIGPDDPDAYINIMEKNLAVLKEALS
jgi:zinc transport system substrate-binding protein